MWLLYPLFCCLILKDKAVFSNNINRMFLKDHLSEFLEYSSFSQYVFDYKVLDKCQTTYAVFVEKLYFTCKQPDIGERMKQFDGCNSWFHGHCENFKMPPNSPYNLSNWFCRACQKLPVIHINSLPYKIFFKVCLADERMFAVIALFCQKWSLFINEKFVERVHYAWLDRKYDAQSWSKELKEKFRKPLIIENCFHCNRRYKVERDITEHLLLAWLYSLI